jgi:hypothetical protein
MAYLIFKYLTTALIIAGVSEIAKRSERLGAVIAALPLVTVLTLIWLYVERQPDQRIINHAFYTFWYVLPTLPMFLLFPWLMPKAGFWGALLASVAVTWLCFVGFAWMMERFGIELW